MVSVMTKTEPESKSAKFWKGDGKLIFITCWLLYWCYWRPNHSNPKKFISPKPSWRRSSTKPLATDRSISLNPNKSNPLGIKSNPHSWESSKSSFTQQKTERYWKVAVADLHDLRFGLATEDEEDETPLRALHKIQTAYESKLLFVRVMSTAQVDPDLVTMVEKHSAMDREFLEFVSQMQEELKRRGFSEDYSPPRAQVEHGLKILTELQSDPSLLEKLPPKEQDLARISLTMAECFDRQLESGAEQYHDIELMQARLQGRYPAGSFWLPKLSEVEE